MIKNKLQSKETNCDYAMTPLYGKQCKLAVLPALAVARNAQSMTKLVKLYTSLETVKLNSKGPCEF